MKALIVTFVRAYNYGAVLQCYALSQKLRQLGVDVEVLDYYPQYFKDSYNVASLRDARYFPYRPLKNWLKYLPFLRIRDRRNEGFSGFLQQHIPLTATQYTVFDEIDHDNLEYDVFISGSDQVWANLCVPFDPVYFLQFSSAKQAKRYSYAASFGFTKVPDKLEGDYRLRLSSWDGYSVREESGKKILQELVGEEATVSCDPTLLLDKTQWDMLAVAPREKRYILVYTVNATKELLQYAKELSEKKQLPVIVLPCWMEEEHLTGRIYKPYGFKTNGYASPQEWLGYFANATYVLTDSFHGTVFSTINHRPFMTVTQHDGRENFRAKELLAKLELSDRQLPGDLKKIDDAVVWDDVDIRRENLRSGSEQYLKQMLENL